MPEAVRILHAEDLATDAELAAREIREAVGPCEFRRVETPEEFLRELREFRPDLVVSDFRMPRFDGLTALLLAREHAPDVPVVILTGAINEDTAVECMKSGASDYVIKEHLKRLGHAVLQALEKRRVIAERRAAEAANRRLETELLRAQKLEALGRLAGGVAHDFNNMLSVILGYAEIAHGELPPDHPVRDDLAEIRSAATRSRDITRQLLAFSRNQELAPRVLDPNALVAETTRSLSRLIGEDVELHLEAAPLAWSVRFDPSQLQRILVNLAINARDAMPRGGRLTIATANVRRAAPGAGVEGDYVRVTVRDTGTGMDAETLARLFEPFFTTKAPGKGTGLGLSTVYGILQQAGGFVEVHSELGRGTAFELHVPRAEGVAEPVAPAEEPAPAERRAGTILVVDDCEMVCRVVCQMLMRLGHRVLALSDPHEALALCRSGTTIDLLLTDVVMPGMDGCALAEAARQACPGLKVLLMSGYPANRFGRQPGAGPGLPLIHKPFASDEIARKIHEVLAA